MRTLNATRIDRTPIYKIFRDLGVEKEQIKLESSFASDLDYDDLDWLLLKYFIENRMKVQIVDRDIVNISTIGDLVNLVESKKEKYA
jgi:acyl carrier protein